MGPSSGLCRRSLALCGQVDIKGPRCLPGLRGWEAGVRGLSRGPSVPRRCLSVGPALPRPQGPPSPDPRARSSQSPCESPPKQPVFENPRLIPDEPPVAAAACVSGDLGSSCFPRRKAGNLDRCPGRHVWRASSVN